MWVFYTCISNNEVNGIKEVTLPFTAKYMFDVSVTRTPGITGTAMGATMFITDNNGYELSFRAIPNNRYKVYTGFVGAQLTLVVEVETSEQYNIGIYYWVD